MSDFTGTPEHLIALRETCLVRDRHRCVVTGAFNQDEALTPFEGPAPALDDDGHPLIGTSYAFVEVAHIIPYALTKNDDDGCIGEGKKAVVAILNMFDLGVAHLIEGADINRLYNALTLSIRMHKFFGRYKIFFERLPDTPSSTYRINSFLPPPPPPPPPPSRARFLLRGLYSYIRPSTLRRSVFLPSTALSPISYIFQPPVTIPTRSSGTWKAAS